MFAAGIANHFGESERHFHTAKSDTTPSMLMSREGVCTFVQCLFIPLTVVQAWITIRRIPLMKIFLIQVLNDRVDQGMGDGMVMVMVMRTGMGMGRQQLPSVSRTCGPPTHSVTFSPVSSK